MSRLPVHARNLAASWVSHIANMVVFAFLSPFVVHGLGQTEYGIWSLLNVVLGYMGVLDLGVRASVGRHVTLYLGKQDHEAVGETIRTGVGFFLTIGLMILGVGLALGAFSPKLFQSVPQEYYSLLGFLLPLMAAGMMTAALGTIFSSVLTAHERFDLARGVDLGVLAVRSLGTIWAIKYGSGLRDLVIVAVGCNILVLVANWLIAHRIYPRLRSWPPRWTSGRLKELMNYGIFAFLTTISVKIIGQSDLVIAEITINIDAVTVYSVGAMLIYYTVVFVDKISTTLFPALQKDVARGDMKSVGSLFFGQVRLALVLGLPMYIGFAFFSEPFIRLWMLGPEFGEASVVVAGRVMTILAVSKILYLFTVGSNELVLATGHVRYGAFFSIIEAATNLSLSLVFVLVLGWGLPGIAAGTLVARMAVRTFFFPWYACCSAGISFRTYLVKVGTAALIAALLIAAWNFCIRWWLPVNSWVEFSIAVTAVLLGCVPVTLGVLLTQNDRRLLGNHWRRLHGKLTRRDAGENI